MKKVLPDKPPMNKEESYEGLPLQLKPIKIDLKE